MHANILTLKQHIFDTFAGYSKSNFEFEKWHVIEHLADSIRRWGRPQNFDTHFFERLHSILVKAHFRCTNFKDYISQMMARARRLRFVQRVLRPLLNVASPIHSVLRPPLPDFMQLRGRMRALSLQGPRPLPSAVTDALPNAWRSLMEATHGEAYDVEAHAWHPERAMRYRGVRVRRDGCIDCIIYDEGRSVVLMQGTDDTGRSVVHDLTDPHKVYSALPLLFFQYNDDAAAPKRKEDAVPLRNADDVDVPPEDDGEVLPGGDSNGASGHNSGGGGGPDGSGGDSGDSGGGGPPATPNLAFVAFYWMKTSQAGSALANSAPPYVCHAPRVVDVATGLVIEPITTMYRPVRTYPLYCATLNGASGAAAAAAAPAAAAAEDAAGVVKQLRAGTRAVRRLGAAAFASSAIRSSAFVFSTQIN